MTDPSSDRTTVKRGKDRAEYSLDAMLSILDAGTVAHMGASTPDGPIVLPMAYGRTNTDILLHGSVANAILRSGKANEVCVTVTIIDGLVIARSAFHNSMNYRSVVIRGAARAIDDPQEKIEALRIITDHVAENWDSRREATAEEIRSTLVIAVPLTEMSAKIRDGGPVDDEADLGGPQWAGTVPLSTQWGQARPADDVSSDCAPPSSLTSLAGSSS